jgi:predicted RND superfamily exporter protein
MHRAIAKFVDALFAKLAALEIARPKTVLAIVGAIAVVCTLVATRLQLRTRYDQLLPDGTPSTVELARVTEHTSGAQTILVTLEGDDTASLRAFADALVVRLRDLGPDRVSSAVDGVHEGRAFVMPRAGLYMKKDELEKLRADVDERWDREVARQTGTSLDDDEPSPQNNDSLRDRLRAAGSNAADRFPDGYYQRKDGHAVVVVVRSPVPAGDLARTRDTVDRVRSATRELGASRPEWARTKIGFAGDMVASLEEYGAVRADLLGVGGTGVVLVLAVIVLYFMRARALVVLASGIAVGLAITFGLTAIVIGHLNVATGFLFSIVAGNGINAGIIWLARYDEERRRGRTPAEAVAITHGATWRATSMAALAAAASYGSLAVTKFPAFHELAFIGAVGMIACWIATVTVIPTLLVLADRKAPSRRGVRYGDVFARAVSAAPHAFVAIGAIVAISGIAATGAWCRSRPLEYDLRKIQTERAPNDPTMHAWDVATDILGQLPQATVILTDSPARSKLLARKLDGDEARPFGEVHTIFEAVPDEQEQKVPTLLAIAARARRAHELKMMSDDEWKQIEPLLPPDDLAPFGIEDLPPGVAAPFTEKNGTRGTIVLVESQPGQRDDDLHYLLRYADALREIHLPDGSIVRGSGRAVVFADILRTVAGDIPVAVAWSLALTIVAVVVALRRPAAIASVLGALAVGVSGVALFLHFAHVRINFLNFAALPITFGIGVDYAVNVMQRHDEDRSAGILETLRTSGGAVVLCSLTTMLGYVALLRSTNQAIRSFGAIAVVGEISCLLAAVLVLPAFLHARGKDRMTSGTCSEAPQSAHSQA